MHKTAEVSTRAFLRAVSTETITSWASLKWRENVAHSRQEMSLLVTHEVARKKKQKDMLTTTGKSVTHSTEKSSLFLHRNKHEFLADKTRRLNTRKIGRAHV